LFPVLEREGVMTELAESEPILKGWYSNPVWRCGQALAKKVTQPTFAGARLAPAQQLRGFSSV
jgi:hypothetical protein